MMLWSSWVSLLIADMFSLMVRVDALLAICILLSDLVIVPLDSSPVALFAP